MDINLTHLNREDNPTMVDVKDKSSTARVAVASGKILMNQEAYKAVINKSAKKGAVIHTAIIAGIMAAKNTSQIIPMCHPLLLSNVDIKITPLENEAGFHATSIVKVEGKTGVEMEALTAVNVALLTIYDMLKAIDKGMIMQDICLESKSGGKSGEFKRRKK